jgi:hypothetical protein
MSDTATFLTYLASLPAWTKALFGLWLVVTAVCAFVLITVRPTASTSAPASTLTPPAPVRRGPVGMLIGPGATRNTFKNVHIEGVETGLINEGTENEFENLKIKK